MTKKSNWQRTLLWSVGSILSLLLGLGVVAYFVAVVGIGGASLPAGMQIALYTDEHIEHIPVALDITPDGTIFVAQTAQFGEGVGDNRLQSFWLLDDQAANSSADRDAYIEKWIKAGEFEADWFTKNADYIIRIRDTDGDGLADSANTFAERRGRLVGLTSGVLVKGKDVWITSIPDVVKYHDRNEDGQVSEDETEILSSGYGFRANFVGHDMHGLTWGPDGKIYYSLGDRGYNVYTQEGKHLQPPIDNGRGAVFRMNPDGSELEVFATGLRNPQEIAFDNYGNLFTGDNNSDGGDKARIVYVVEGGDSGWMSPYQFQANEDYLRGPWNAEKLWHPHHQGQPAWIVPPVANLTSGPSGMAFYPGIGLPDRYQGHFFLADYVFAPIVSHLWSFAVTPEGAGFELDDVHKFATNKLFIDHVFGYDGALYTLSASTFGDNRAIHKIYQEEPEQPQLIAEVQALFQQGFEQLENNHLQQLLAHDDQRVRREAQFELAAREQVALLAAVAQDADADLLPRIHAVWGLGQIGEAGLQQAGWQQLSWLDGQPTELRAQVLKVVGNVKAQWLLPDVTELIADSEPRVQYFASLAAGKIGSTTAIPALVGMLRTNNDQDAYLRHAGVYALELIGNAEALKPYMQDESAAVRMGILLAQRRLQDATIAHFLSDTDPALVVEAARAIYDMRISAAMDPLAGMASTDMPSRGEDEQTSYALHRRAINANLLLGAEHNAEALARYALNDSNPKAMQREALAALTEFAVPEVIDRVIGTYRELPPRDVSVVYAALDEHIPALLETDLKDQAMQVALHYRRVPLSFDELLALVESSDQSVELRVASLQALPQRVSSDGHSQAVTAVDNMLGSELLPLRLAALSVMAQLDSPRAIEASIRLSSQGVIAEQQAAIALLGAVNENAATKRLLDLVQSLRQGNLTRELQLDVIAAAENSAEPALVSAIADYHRSQADNSEIQKRRVAMFGGDTRRGKNVFENQGDCLRCHAIAGRGGNSGPALDGVADNFDADYLLQALVEPAAIVAPGYGFVSLVLADGTTVAGTLLGEKDNEIRVSGQGSHGEGEGMVIPRSDIASQTAAVSGMPPMGLVLSRHDLRDVMAYLASLKVE